MASRAFNGRGRFTQDDEPLGQYSRGFPPENQFETEGLVRGRFPIVNIDNDRTE